MPEQVEGRNRLTGFFPVRIILSLPHVIVLVILGIFVTLATIVAWLGGTVLGQLPEWLHNFIAGTPAGARGRAPTSGCSWTSTRRSASGRGSGDS